MLVIKDPDSHVTALYVNIIFIQDSGKGALHDMQMFFLVPYKRSSQGRKKRRHRTESIFSFPAEFTEDKNTLKQVMRILRHIYLQ